MAVMNNPIPYGGRIFRRVVIVLMAAEEPYSYASIRRRIKNKRNRHTVAHWIKAFSKGRVQRLLKDNSRSGRPPKITKERRELILSELKKNLRRRGRRLSIGAIAKKFQVKPMTVWRLNQAMDAK